MGLLQNLWVNVEEPYRLSVKLGFGINRSLRSLFIPIQIDFQLVSLRKGLADIRSFWIEFRRTIPGDKRVLPDQLGLIQKILLTVDFRVTMTLEILAVEFQYSKTVNDDRGEWWFQMKALNI